MSALGRKRTSSRVPTMSALPPKAHIADRREDVRSSLLFNFQLPALVRPRFAFARRACVFEINCSNNGYLRQCGAEMIAPTWAEHRSDNCVRNLWSCEACGQQSEDFVYCLRRSGGPLGGGHEALTLVCRMLRRWRTLY